MQGLARVTEESFKLIEAGGKKELHKSMLSFDRAFAG